MEVKINPGIENLCRATICEICGEKILTPIHKSARSICEKCAQKLNKLINSEDN